MNAAADDKQVSGGTVASVVRYVRSLSGRAGVDQLLAIAGEVRPVEEVDDPAVWSTYAQAVALFRAAATVTRDPGVSRRIGAASLRLGNGSETVTLLRSLGNPAEVIRCVAMAAGKLSAVTVMEAVEVGERSAVVHAITGKGYTRDIALCEFAAGVLTQASALFGMAPATVVETHCATKGWPHCRYEVRWDPTPTPEPDPLARVADLEQQLQLMSTRFEALQATASDLVQAQDVGSALATITRRAGVAVRSPRFLLAVRLPGERDIRVHATGFSSQEEVDAATAEILADRPDEHGGSRLIVDVASAHHWYGRLCALHHDGIGFFPTERKLLTSYAGHAVAALESAAALEEARRRGAVTAALLNLSRSLAEVCTSSEVAERLAEAVPDIVDCQEAVVLLWDPSQQCLVFGARSGSLAPPADTPQHAIGRFTVDAADAAAIAPLLAQREPSFLPPGPPGADALRTAVVPIVSKDDVFGVVTVTVRAADPAANPDQVADADADLLERLGGMAGQAATALENARLLERVRQQALHDPLTGLPNRSLFKDRIDQNLREARRDGNPIALLFIDLDHFKEVNDTFGHSAGDELICTAAARLAGGLRDVDTVARVGGDEFALVLPDAGHDAAIVVARRLVAAMADPVTIEGHILQVSASIGIVIGSAGDDYETLVKEADAAMYKSKAAGRGTWAVADRDEGNAVPERRTLEHELRVALAGRQLHVVYQPQFDLASNRVVGAEALVRWKHPERGWLRPGDFLPVAESSGLIVPLDHWVLETACCQLAAWQAGGLPEVRIAVNMGRRTLLDPALPRVVRGILDHSGVSPALLEIEVADGVRPDDRLQLERVMAQLAAVGVRLALDGFGTDRHSMHPRSASSVDTIKIHRAFVAGIDNEVVRQPIVSATLALARSLGLAVVASGVETTAQADFLRAEGCETVQGYLFSRPVEAAAVADMLRQELPVA